MIYEIIKDTKKYPNMEEQIKDLIESKRDIYIFGGITKGKRGGSLGSFVRMSLEKQNIDFKGYLAHTKFIQDSIFQNKPVYALESHNIANPQDVSVIIGIEYFSFAKEELQKYGFKHFYFFDACSENFCEQFDLEYIKKHDTEFTKAYNIFSEQRSKETFIGYLKAKIFCNFNDLFPYRDPSIYYNDLFFTHSKSNGKDEVMIDCGAFDGDSTLDFIKECKEYKMVYAFEPDLQNFQKLLQNTKNHRVKAINKGVYSRDDILKFHESKDDSAGSAFCNNGEIQIPVTTIDSIVFNDKFNGGGEIPITFIKMDIEGSELEALKGAKETIKQFKPKLAICVYHKKEDLLEIPQYILSLNPGYKLFLRNAASIPTDVVLYAL